MKLRNIFFAALLASAAFLPASAKAMQAGSPSAATAKQTTGAVAAPSAQQIADAKAKGLVWVNLNTRVYHKDGSLYGTTKKGKFMTEAEAVKAGYRAAKEPKATEAGSKK